MTNFKQISKVGVVLLIPTVICNICIVEASTDPTGRRFDRTEDDWTERYLNWLANEKECQIYDIPSWTKIINEAVKRASQAIDQKKPIQIQDMLILKEASLLSLKWELFDLFERNRTFEIPFSHENPSAGLENIGATCYLNSTFQLLFQIFPLRQAIEEYDGENLIVLVLKFFFKAMRTLQVLNENFMNKVIDMLQILIQHFNFRQQQDVEEFLELLLDKFREVFNRKMINSCFGFDMKTTLSKNGAVFGESIVLENILGLYLPKQVGDLTLEELVKDYFAPSEIDYKDDEGLQIVGVEKKEEIVEVPEYLIVQTRLVQWPDDGAEQGFKVDNHVKTSQEIHIPSSKGPVKMELVAIVYHRGIPKSGHYVIKVQGKGNWFVYNDGNKGETLPYSSPEDPYTPCVYLFRRVKGQGNPPPQQPLRLEVASTAKLVSLDSIARMPALENLGGSCFFNAVVWLILQMDPLLEAIINYSGKNEMLIEFAKFFNEIVKDSNSSRQRKTMGRDKIKNFLDKVFIPLIGNKFPESEHSKLETYKKGHGSDVDFLLFEFFESLEEVFQKDGKPDPTECCCSARPINPLKNDKIRMKICNHEGKGIDHNQIPVSSKFLLASIAEKGLKIPFEMDRKVPFEMDHAGKKYDLKSVVFYVETDNGAHFVVVTFNGNRWSLCDDKHPLISFTREEIQKIQSKDPETIRKLLENHKGWMGLNPSVSIHMLLYVLPDN
jgi:ubiquitin C-terminal hydrolase